MTHFSIYVLMGATNNEVSPAYAYPVPYRPKKGKVSGKGIQFTKLPSECVIRIYSINGELVTTIRPASGSIQYDWDVKNAGGDEIASGVYIYVIESNGKKKTDKLMIIR